MSVDKSKKFPLIPKKATRAPFCCCSNYAAVGHIGMQIFNFFILSVIIAPHNILIPHITKSYLSIVTLNACELELN